MAGEKRPYDETVFNRGRLDRFAQKVARELLRQERPLRPPVRPLYRVRTSTVGPFWNRQTIRETEVIKEAVLEPQVWVVKFHPSDGWAERADRGTLEFGHSFMEEGEALLLTPSGALLWSNYWLMNRAGGEFAELTNIQSAQDSSILWMDNSRGKYVKQGRRWVYRRRNLPCVHARGIGASRALKSLLEGSGRDQRLGLDEAPLDFNYLVGNRDERVW